MNRRHALATLTALPVLLAGCGKPRDSSGATSTPTPGAKVTVLYAGSLLTLMERGVGPAFTTKTGHPFSGEGKGSQALANEIRGKVTRADVFVSASPDADDMLRGGHNGDWVSWYATFASSPLVLGYNRHSRFARRLQDGTWRAVIAAPGFRLGRTDPRLDPKGKLSLQALDQVGLGRLAHDQAGVYPEEALVGRLQAGQLDAGFFYSGEAAEHHIPTVDLTPVELGATYTVTVLNRAKDPDAAAAFVRYLLSDDGATVLRRHGLRVRHPPALTGPRSAVPRQLQAYFRRT